MNRLLLCALLVLLSSHAVANSVRCGRALVKVGHSSNALIKKCGSPLRKYSSKETINEDGRQQRVGVSNWVYERQGKKNMIVSIRSGTVMKIQVD